MRLDDYKPGEHLAVFAPTVSVHRFAIALEDAGFEIRDQLVWLNDHQGRSGLFLQGSVAIVLARRPPAGTIAENVLKFGTGALNIDACRIPHDDPDIERKKFDSPLGMEHCARDREGERGAGPSPLGRFPANVLHDGSEVVLNSFPDTKGAGGSMPLAKVTGYGTNIGDGSYAYDNSARISFDSGEGSAGRFFKSAGSLADVVDYIQTLISPQETGVDG